MGLLPAVRFKRYLEDAGGCFDPLRRVGFRRDATSLSELPHDRCLQRHKS